MTDQFHGPYIDPIDDPQGKYRAEILTKALEALNGVFMIYAVDEAGPMDQLHTAIVRHINASSARHTPKRPVGRPKTEQKPVKPHVVKI
jgi:hypothetical protein